MEGAWRAMAAGAALLASAMLLGAGALVGCGAEGFRTSASPPAAAPGAPTVTATRPEETSRRPAVSFSPSGGSMRMGPFTLGWQFRPTVDIAVTDLGYVDPEQDGLVHRHQVGIFDAQTDQLVVSATVGPRSALDGFFRWEPLEPHAVLRAGHSYLAGAVFVSGDEVRDGKTAWAPEAGHVLTKNGRDFTSALGSTKLVAPHREAVWEGFMAPNFKFRPVSAASPASSPGEAGI